MRYYLKQFSVFIFLLFPGQVFSNDMTLQELFFDETKPYHLKILEALIFVKSNLDAILYPKLNDFLLKP